VILVDTSVWIDHFRSMNTLLVSALEVGDVLTHPFIIGELACGNLRNRQELLTRMNRLPAAQRATDDEALFFIRRYSLMGRGIGLVDVHILAGALLTHDTELWTSDKRLAEVADELDIKFHP
jgi:predicted nucleic acid-binding protein